MKWKGNDNDRAGFTERFLNGGGAASERGNTKAAGLGVQRDGSNDGGALQGNKSGAGRSDAVHGKESRRGRADDVSAVYDEINSLSERELKNLGVVK